jgi:hypothetical protein
MCWSATDGICSKGLAPFLPELLERLRHWHALRHISAETIEHEGDGERRECSEGERRR